MVIDHIFDYCHSRYSKNCPAYWIPYERNPQLQPPIPTNAIFLPGDILSPEQPPIFLERLTIVAFSTLTVHYSTVNL